MWFETAVRAEVVSRVHDALPPLFHASLRASRQSSEAGLVSRIPKRLREVFSERSVNLREATSARTAPERHWKRQEKRRMDIDYDIRSNLQ